MLVAAETERDEEAGVIEKVLITCFGLFGSSTRVLVPMTGEFGSVRGQVDDWKNGNFLCK